MDILGVGGAELVAIILIMLVVAGPKRMIQWAYVAGQYLAKLRGMWSEVMDHVQAEFDQAGLDVKVPRDIPTRASLNRTINQQINRASAPLTSPVTETLEQLKAQKPASKPAESQPEPQPASLGTWSMPENKAS